MTASVREYPGEYELQVSYDHGKTEIHNLGGIPWHAVPAPFPIHRCWVQTYGYLNYFTRVERCACGARCMGRTNGERFRWIDKNSRRR